MHSTKDFDITNVFVLIGADTSIKVTGLPLTYTGMHFLHQSKFTMRRPITMNILPSHINFWICVILAKLGFCLSPQQLIMTDTLPPSSNESSLDGIGFQIGNVLGTEVINGRTNIRGLKSYDQH